MKTTLAIVACIVLLMQSSCFTPALWEATNPRERIAIAYDDISEDTLKQKGIRYERYEAKEYFLVDKTSMRKLGDYSVRILGTPFAVALDAVTTVAVVGVAVLYMDFNQGVKRNPDYRIELHPGQPF